MSMPHLTEDLVAEHALGVLAEAEARSVRAHLATCERCRQEVAAVREVLSALPAELPRVPAHRYLGLRDAVLAATECAHRYDGFARRMAQLFDVEEATALAYLRAAANPSTHWEAMPGMESAVTLLHFDGGVRTKGADVGIVRFAPGLRFPEHTHKGDEHQLYLQGSAIDDTGREWLPGDFATADSRVRHAFQVGLSEPCVTALVLFDGIEIVGL